MKKIWYFLHVIGILVLTSTRTLRKFYFFSSYVAAANVFHCTHLPLWSGYLRKIFRELTEGPGPRDWAQRVEVSVQRAVKADPSLSPPSSPRQHAQHHPCSEHDGAHDDAGWAQDARVASERDPRGVVVWALALPRTAVRGRGQNGAHQDEQEAERRKSHLAVRCDHHSGNHEAAFDLLHPETRYGCGALQWAAHNLVTGPVKGQIIRVVSYENLAIASPLRPLESRRDSTKAEQPFDTHFRKKQIGEEKSRFIKLTLALGCVHCGPGTKQKNSNYTH